MRVMALVFAVQLATASGYEQQIQRWRAEREQKLRAPDGWLSLVGLFWLKDGQNSVGSADTASVRLPAGLPQHAGTITKQAARVVWKPVSGASRELKTDRTGSADVVRVGRLRLSIIERGSAFGVRIKDSQSETRRFFQGLDWFPIRPEWRVTARFVTEPKKVSFDAQAGDRQEMESPGYVVWEQAGRRLRLTPVTEDGQLFFVFRDTTAGKTTYPAARFIYTDPPKNGVVTIDFNKAYNPPCVFTPYATCPLPPPENRLPIPVEAGEKMYRGH